MNKKETKTNRIIYLDIVRIVACFLVVLVHVAAQHIYDNNFDTAFFKVHAAYNCLAFSGVSLYIMISGALMLHKDRVITVRTAIKKSLHFYLLYFVWKFIFCIFDAIKNNADISMSYIKNVLTEVISGRGYYHLWFLPTIAILYLFIPVIKKSVENDKKVCQLYLTIFFIIGILAETAFNFDFKFKYIFTDFLQYNDFYLFTGYLGYYLLGHYINRFGDEIKKSVRIVIYLLAVLSLVLSGLIDSLLSMKSGDFTIPMNTPFSLPSFLMTTAIFLFIKNIVNQERFTIKNINIISTLSVMTLGIYLIHPMILYLAEKFGFNSLLFNPIISLPVITIVITAVTAILVFILIKIPVINKLIK